MIRVGRITLEVGIESVGHRQAPVLLTVGVAGEQSYRTVSLTNNDLRELFLVLDTLRRRVRTEDPLDSWIPRE